MPPSPLRAAAAAGVLLLSASGCAVSGPVQRPSVPVAAVVGDRVLIGSAEFLGDQGRFTVLSADDRDLVCSGTFRYREDGRGEADFRCHDGSRGRLRLEAGPDRSGIGHGDTELGPATVVYGPSTERMNAALPLPEGHRLIDGPHGPILTGAPE